MRKHIDLIFEFYRGSCLGIILITIVMTFSVYTFVNVAGINEYIGYAKKVYNNSNLENALYFTPSKNDDYYSLSSAEQKSADNKLRDKLLSLNGVKGFCINRAVTGIYDGKFINLILYDDIMLDKFNLNIDEGEWLNRNNTKKCVIGGELFKNSELGGEVNFTFGDESISAVIQGKLSSPAYIPQFLGGYSADELFIPLDNIIIMYYSQDLMKEFESNSINVIEYENYFIMLSDKINSDERLAVTDMLDEYGRYYTYSDIIKNTDERNVYLVKTKLPFPLYSFFISSIALLSMSILITEKKMREYAVYYITGCSKLRSVIIITSSLFLITLIPCGLNIANILINPYQFRGASEQINASNCYISEKMIFPILLYMLAMILISVGSAVSIYIKESTYEICRRSE